ncbi:tyrosine-type recombinase/integrase [Paenibacillus sp. JNUCC31]|uniref:tyrosine-type recombinase/integrase n=1 Tax=Paenibacillus sp. JNUCC-31 TaxID=2777983 RepID=UPI001783A78D|nr:tyrosine-type recombinase/integrase [Paenibacillus sp. JNUCC-31]QOS80171.1 tyrosine-type recombinase/integrase [Paenibacillus sp. JNUCC-31]
MILKFAVQEFKDDREYKNLSPKTIAAYLLTLKEFQAFCSEQEIVNVEDVTTSLIKSYLLYCQKERENNPTTRNSKLHTIKIFFNYLEEVEIIDSKKNPIKRLSYVKEDIKIEAFSDYHITQMLNYYRRINSRNRTFHAYRDYTIIITLLGTGVRLGELINLKWNDIDFKSGTVTVYGKKREQSSIPLTDKLIKELSEYQVFCRQTFKTLSEYVFTSDRKNEQLKVESVKSLFRRLKAAMNFKDVRLSCHTFRHTFAHRMLMNGCDVFTLQKMLRHSQISMTQKYLSIWGTALREQNAKYNPLNGMDL